MRKKLNNFKMRWWVSYSPLNREFNLCVGMCIISNRIRMNTYNVRNVVIATISFFTQFGMHKLYSANDATVLIWRLKRRESQKRDRVKEKGISVLCMLSIRSSQHACRHVRLATDNKQAHRQWYSHAWVIDGTDAMCCFAETMTSYPCCLCIDIIICIFGLAWDLRTLLII